MATKKISELEAITEADGSDVLAIVDVSEGKTNKITKNNLLIGAGHSIEMSLNQETYALTLTLKNAAGTELSTASIDLPNENSITDISYNNGKLTLTKQSGATTEVDITGLINGLVTESDFSTFTTQLNQVLQSLDETKADAEDVEALQTRVTELEQENEDLKNNQLTNTPEKATSHYLQDSADARFRKFIPIGRTTQSNLPEGYTQLDYITSDGSSYIDTGIVLGKNYKVDVKFVNNVSRNDEQPIVSIWTASTNWWNLFINSSGVLDFYAKGHNYLDEVTIGEEQNINIIRDENNTTVIKNGQSFTIPVSYTETNNTTLKILKRGDNQGDSRASILSVNVYNDNILVGNFVPCKDVSNKIGLYDLVTKTFFANAGTGTFTAGDVSVPTPKTPIPIKNTGDNGSVNEKVQNKNLIGLGTQLNGYVDGTSMKMISTSGTPSSLNSIGYYFKTSILPDEITFSCDGGNRANVCYFDEIPANNVTCLSRSPSNTLPRTLSVNKNYSYVHIQFSYNDTNLTNIQLEQGLTASNYQAHSEQNISFPLAEGQKLYEGEELKENGKDDMFGELVFTGIENYDWKKSTTYDGSYYFYPNNYGLDYKEYSEFKCSHAICVKSSSNYKIGKCFAESAINLWLGDGTQLPTPTAFKAYLAEQYANGTPVTIVYKKANPTITPYTEEQQRYYDEHIKSLRTYKNVTHISSEDETPANVDITYVRDLETVINNLTTRVETIESEV